VFPLRVFVSHSMSESDQDLVKDSCTSLNSIAVEVILSERDFQSGRISNKVRNDIRRSDCVMTLLTEDGRDSAWVEQEIGIAIEQDKIIIPMLEKGLSPPGAISEIECIYFTRDNYFLSIESAIRYIAEEKLG